MWLRRRLGRLPPLRLAISSSFGRNLEIVQLLWLPAGSRRLHSDLEVLRAKLAALTGPVVVVDICSGKDSFSAALIPEFPNVHVLNYDKAGPDPRFFRVANARECIQTCACFW
jgi:hypothetical protein